MQRDQRKNRPAPRSRSAKRHDSPAARIAGERRSEREALAALQAQQQRQERQREQRELRRRREETKKRDSRGAQEAQRRREEQKERSRLNDFRNKQKRQAKHRKQRRISPDAWKRFMIMAGIIVAVVLSMVIFFRVRDVKVQGSRYYSAEEIEEAAGIADGDNLLTLSRGEIAGNIIARLPYVKTVRVTRKLPDTVVISVTEHETTFCIKATDGHIFLMTAAGKVTQELTERESRSYIQVLEPQIETPKIGETVRVTVPAEAQLDADSLLAALTQTLQAIERADLAKNVESVRIPSALNISLQYEDRFDVKLGDVDRIDYKLEYLKAVIAEQKSYVTGTIDLTFNNGEEAHVMPEE